MATTEKTGIFTVKDRYGEKTLLYPITKAEAVDGLEENYSKKSKFVDAILVAGNWAADKTYTISVNGVTNISNQEILPGFNLPDEQLLAWHCADLQDGGQTENSITLVARGIVPTIDVPIRILLRGDM